MNWVEFVEQRNVLGLFRGLLQRWWHLYVATDDDELPSAPLRWTLQTGRHGTGGMRSTPFPL